MQNTDEIDLLEFFQTIWDSKFKIVGVIVMAVLGVLCFFYTQSLNSCTSKTDVKQITSDMTHRHKLSNILGFFTVEAATLQNLFIERLDARLLFENAFLEHSV
jgi:LPS O-antigen subunit length determinant protein (WzzB/FepE family)